MDKKILWALIAIVIIAAAVYYLTLGRRGAVPNQAQAPSVVPPTAGETATQMQPTSDPDAIVSGLLQDTSALPSTPAESDPTLLNANDQTISNFDQSLNTSQF